MKTLLAIDAGTTAMKAAVFDTQGRMLSIDRQEYTLETPAPNWVELDAEVYWRSCARAVKNALAKSGADGCGVVALAISSQGETIIPLDEAGRPTRKAIVWLDNRPVDEARSIATHFKLDTVQQVTGQTEISPLWPACKILWIKNHEPGVFARTDHYCLVEDYLMFRLTGHYTANLPVYSSSLFVDIVRQAWWLPMFDFIGITPSSFGKLVEPGSVVGQLCQAAAVELGLTGNTIAVSGGLDQTIGALGAGNIRTGMISETTGSALAIIATLDGPLFDPARRAPCFYHSVPGVYTLMPWCQTAGMALRWFRDQFYAVETARAKKQGGDVYEQMSRDAASVAPGCGGLLVLPHLEGASCPELNPAARGVFFGATLRHTRAHFTRGIMESVAYMLKRNLDLIEQLGCPVGEVFSIGGGARSPVWLQIKADVVQKPVYPVENEEAACLGAAITAATAAGVVENLEVGVATMVRYRQRVEPKHENFNVYTSSYSRYIELYDRLAPFFETC